MRWCRLGRVPTPSEVQGPSVKFALSPDPSPPRHCTSSNHSVLMRGEGGLQLCGGQSRSKTATRAKRRRAACARALLLDPREDECGSQTTDSSRATARVQGSRSPAPLSDQRAPAPAICESPRMIRPRLALAALFAVSLAAPLACTAPIDDDDNDGD